METIKQAQILEEIKQREDILTGGALNSIRLYAKAFNEKDEIISKKIEGNKKIVTLKDGSNITIGEEYRLESYNNIIDKNIMVYCASFIGKTEDIYNSKKHCEHCTKSCCIKTFKDNEENKKKAKELLITTMKKIGFELEEKDIDKIIINKEQNMYNITFNMIKGNKEVIGKANINPNLGKIYAIKLEYNDKIQ